MIRFSCHCDQVLPEGPPQTRSHVKVDLHLSNIRIQSRDELDNKGEFVNTPFQVLNLTGPDISHIRRRK